MPVEPGPRPQKVLVIENTPAIVLVIVRLLERLGHTVHHVETCAAAIAAIAEADEAGQPFRTILAAVRVDDGFTSTVCELVQEQVECGQLRWIATSGDWGSDANLKSRLYYNVIGAARLDKPFNMQLFYQAFEQQ